jgi:N-acetylneuraminate synthase
MSGNHNQSLERALILVKAAAKAGAHALKLQTYSADTMTLNVDSDDFKINDVNSLWNGAHLHDLYHKAHTPWQWHKPIFELARELGMIPFSSPFDASAVDFLEGLDVACYKIASFENTDLNLIRKVASTGKPLILSTGMGSLADLERAVSAAREAGCTQLALLKCTSTYPADPKNTNLHTISHMRELFGCEVGLSDHTAGLGVAMASVALGASVIEKHFKLDKKDGGGDIYFSIEPDELAQLVTETQRAHLALGEVKYGASIAEQKSLQFRRSIYASENIKAGEIFSLDNIRIIRPGFGLAPRHFDGLMGKRCKKAIDKGTALRWSLVD